VRAVDSQCREASVSPLPIHSSAKDQMVAAPTMVAAIAVAGEGPAKIAGGKGGHIARQTQLFHRALEGKHALAQFRQQIRMRTNRGLARAGRLAGMQIVAADFAEKYLPFHSESAISDVPVAGFDQPRYHPKLRRQR